MLSKRLSTIASLVPNNKKTVDIGTDHAYLPIYLYESGITNDITASDVSKNVLEYSLANLKKHHLDDKINLVLSDGFTNLSDDFEVAILAGMGTNTILSILNSAKKIPDTLIIASNNDHYLLRKSLYNMGYYMDHEVVINEANIYYVIIRFKKGTKTVNEDVLLFGLSNNKEYFLHLINYYMDIYKKSKDDKYLKYIEILKRLIEKKLD